MILGGEDLELQYKTKKLEEQCNNYKKAIKAFGDKSARKLHQRIKEIKSVNNLEIMVKCRIGRCHPLKGNMKGLFALDLEHPYRLIIEPIFDKFEELKYVNVVKVLEVKDYHGK